MIEQYRVGITVYLNDLAGKGLKKLGGEMMQSQARVNALQRDLNKTHRSSDAAASQAVAAQRRATAAQTAAMRSQEQLASKSNRLHTLRVQQQNAQEQHAIRQQKHQSVLQWMATQRAAEQLTTANKLSSKAASLADLRSKESSLLKQQAEDAKKNTQSLAHVWDRAAIAQHQLFKTRVLTGERIKKLDKEIADREEVIAIAKKRHQKVTPLRKEVAELRERRDALQAGLTASEMRTRLTGEELSGKGAALQAAMLAGSAKTKGALEKNLAAQRAVAAEMDAEREASAARLAKMDERRGRVISSMQAGERAHAAQQQASATKIQNVERQIQREKTTFAEKSATAQLAQFEMAKHAAVKSQMAIAERAVIEQQKAELASQRVIAARQSRLRTVMGAGVATAAGGVGLLAAARGMIPEASEYQRSLMAVQATNPAMVDQFRAAANKVTATTAPWMSMNSAMQTMLDLHKAFGHPEEAVQFLGPMARLQGAMVATLPNMTFERAREGSFSIAKALELFGKASKKNGGYADFNDWLQRMGKVILFSGGRIGGEDFQQLAKFVGPQVTSLSAEFMFEKLPWLMTAMKSGGGGLSNNAVFGPGARLNAMLRWIQGVDSLSSEKASALNELGLLQPGVLDKKGKVLHRKPLIGADLAARDPIEWLDKIFIPAFEKNVGAIDWDNMQTKKYNFMQQELTLPQIVQQVTRGNTYAGSITSMLLQNLHGAIKKEMEALKLQWTPEQILEYQGNKSWFLQSTTGEEQRKKTQELLGMGALERWVEYLGLSNKALIFVNEQMTKHPTLTRLVGEAMVDLGLILTAIGTTATVIGLAKWAGGITLITNGLTALGTAVGAQGFLALMPLATGLGAVALALGGLFVAVKYYTDEDFAGKLDQFAARNRFLMKDAYWDRPIDWIKQNLLGQDPNGKKDWSVEEKKRYNMMALSQGTALPFPDIVSENAPPNPIASTKGQNFVTAPKTPKPIRLENYIMLDRRQIGKSVSEFMVDEFGLPVSDFAAPDFREIPTRSSGRKER